VFGQECRLSSSGRLNPKVRPGFGPTVGVDFFRVEILLKDYHEVAPDAQLQGPQFRAIDRTTDPPADERPRTGVSRRASEPCKSLRASRREGLPQRDYTSESRA
jgi:hypothetical protein